MPWIPILRDNGPPFGTLWRQPGSAEPFEVSSVQPDYEAVARPLGHGTVVCPNVGPTGSPRRLSCECDVRGEIRGSPRCGAECGEWRVVRNCQGYPFSQWDHRNRTGRKAS